MIKGANAAAQSRARDKRRSQGLCCRCPNKTKNRAKRGQPKDHPCLCEECSIKMRLQRRKDTNSKPWRKGGRGRPPKYTCNEPSPVVDIGNRDGNRIV